MIASKSSNGLLHNESEFQLLTYLKKKTYYAISFDGYINKWGKNDPDIVQQFGFIYRFIIVFTENGKWKKLFINPHLTIGMYFLRVLVGIVLLLNTK